jgi:hypothetical protein
MIRLARLLHRLALRLDPSLAATTVRLDTPMTAEAAAAISKAMAAGFASGTLGYRTPTGKIASY